MTVATKFYSNTMVGPLTDRSKIDVTTSSAALLAENKDRRFLLLQNVSDVSMGLNLAGGTAAVAGTGTVTLAAGAQMLFDAGFVPSNAVTVIAASGSNKVIVVLEG